MDKKTIDEYYLDDLKTVLKDKVFKYDIFKQNIKHKHCEYCMKEISKDYPNSLRDGYHSISNYYWFCNDCFKKYKNRLNLREYDNITLLNYKNILELFEDNLRKIYNKQIYYIDDIKDIIEYWEEIELDAVSIKIIPAIYVYGREIDFINEKKYR